MTIASAPQAYINVPYVYMREEADENSKGASSAFLAEPVFVLSEKNGWLQIKTAVDEYKGWIPKQVTIDSETGKTRASVCAPVPDTFADPSSTIMRVNRFTAHLYREKDTERGPVMTLPFESRVVVITPKEERENRWLEVALPDGTQLFVQRGDISLENPILSLEEMCEKSKKFIGIEYIYGGRSSFGYDCSGYVQMLYRLMGIHIPRDSKDQVHFAGFSPVAKQDLHPGDLVFFSSLSTGNVGHVGLYLGDDEFIHATIAENKPWIHISSLSDPAFNGGRYNYYAGRTLKK